MMYSNIFTILILIGLTTCNKEVERIQPNYRPMVESVYASATVQPEGLYLVYPKVSGLIESVFVEEGAIVKKGQKIAQIINTTPQVQVQNAELNVRLAKLNYEGQANILKEMESEIQSGR